MEFRAALRRFRGLLRPLGRISHEGAALVAALGFVAVMVVRIRLLARALNSPSSLRLSTVTQQLSAFFCFCTWRLCLRRG